MRYGFDANVIHTEMMGKEEEMTKNCKINAKDELLLKEVF